MSSDQAVGRVLTMADEGATVSITQGQPVEIRLPQIGGTAYLWHLDAPGVRILSDEVTTSSDAPGAAAERVLRCLPAGAGEHVLRLERHRPWEGPEHGDASFEVTLQVR